MRTNYEYRCDEQRYFLLNINDILGSDHVGPISYSDKYIKGIEFKLKWAK